MKPGADLKSKLSTPPSESVEWEVELPEVLDWIDPKLLRIVGTDVKRRVVISRRRVPRRLFVIARTWIEARTQAVREWARRGVLVSPQSVREGRMLA